MFFSFVYFSFVRGSQRGCYIKKLFLKIPQYSQENTCWSPFLIKGCFCVNIAIEKNYVNEEKYANEKSIRMKKCIRMKKSIPMK